ncbi:PQQ-like beta-propeller repeat protein [Cellulophaga sp. E16_2]|nr:PQQ-like beta-propeller repeat protein [Cellulophaga sp. E16_2]
MPKTDVYNKEAGWEVKKFIGVLDNKLWIALNHHTIISLDIATGQLKQQISSIPDFNSEWLPSAIPSPESMIITAENNKLFGFMWEFYWEINPKNGLIEFTDLTNYLKEYNIRNDNPNYVLVGDIIYFISQHVSAIGGFNRKTKKLNWHFKFQANKDGQFPKLKGIKGNEQMLGALDLDGNLYVFENNKPAITHALRA